MSPDFKCSWKELVPETLQGIRDVLNVLLRVHDSGQSRVASLELEINGSRLTLTEFSWKQDVC